jgi:hypothetical protein
MEAGKPSVTKSNGRKSLFFRVSWKKAVIGLVVPLSFMGSIFFWRELQRPIKGKVLSVNYDTPEPSFENKKKRLYQGKYVEFLYSDVYAEKSHETPKEGPVRERIWLTSSNVEGKKISLVVTKRDRNELESEPAYNMRKRNTEDYRSYPLSGEAQGVVFANYQAPFEVTAFFVKNGYVLSVSISSLLKNDELDDELSTFLQELHSPFL